MILAGRWSIPRPGTSGMPSGGCPAGWPGSLPVVEHGRRENVARTGAPGVLRGNALLDKAQPKASSVAGARAENPDPTDWKPQKQRHRSEHNGYWPRMLITRTDEKAENPGREKASPNCEEGRRKKEKQLRPSAQFRPLACAVVKDLGAVSARPFTFTEPNLVSPIVSLKDLPAMWAVVGRPSQNRKHTERQRRTVFLNHLRQVWMQPIHCRSLLTFQVAHLDSQPTRTG
jgi:hypothetical protein